MRYKDYCDMLDKFKPDFKKQHIAFRTDSGASRSYLVKKVYSGRAYNEFCSYFVLQYNQAPVSHKNGVITLTPKLDYTFTRQRQVQEKYPEYFL